jgi:YD repeat-containing protein
LAKESYDAFNDGSVEMTVTYTPVGKDKKSYDKVTATDYDANGFHDYVTTETFIYDKKGQLTSLTNLADYDANGTIDYGNSIEYTYDKQGRVTQEVQTADEYSDGSPDYVSTINTTYDKGNVVKTEVIMDYAGGNDYQYATDYIYNKGLLQKAITNSDWEADGAVNQTDTVSYVYDGKNLLREEYDYTTDGTIETVIEYDFLIS